MKHLIISDLHHENNEYKIRYQLNFLNLIKNFIMANNIKSVFLLGDTLDKRRIADIKLLNLFRDKHKEILDVVDQYIVLRGNHDTYYRTSGNMNSLKIIFTDERYTIVDDEPLKLDNLCFIPWIDPNNKDKLTEFVSENNKKGNYLFSHLNLSGFDIPVKDHLYKSDYENYSKVFSGHFHNRVEKDNVLFVGNPYQKSFGEMVVKGFHVFDDETGEIEFIENSADIFKIIIINDGDNIDECIKNISKRIIKVKINSVNKKFIDECINKINEMGPQSCKYTFRSLEIDTGVIQSDENEYELIDNYLNAIPYDSDKEKEIFCNIFLKTFEKIKEE